MSKLSSLRNRMSDIGALIALMATYYGDGSPETRKRMPIFWRLGRARRMTRSPRAAAAKLFLVQSGQASAASPNIRWKAV